MLRMHRYTFRMLTISQSTEEYVEKIFAISQIADSLCATNINSEARKHRPLMPVEHLLFNFQITFLSPHDDESFFGVFSVPVDAVFANLLIL